ncbi:acyltransferase family protein [Microbacterium telephonicum]|uniref:Peptidoglycan/LPS O-acetylase OafA/YrhL n=1 Tax=Microbacterium telephonicum TaxID=1714841 RepID=A0A498BX59_9MICO|nr:acyltransferase family protein [Microbacterium telephonicum]RLK48015.1 peptidoglycan/LPS O-acetylase OafA/YrhL [Microbacterium telephonicum]
MSTQTRRFAGLDGLRAVAVLLVVVYHLFPGAGLSSGFVGVDVFFVISGFLITSLLLREKAATGRIALGPFWKRRARRLLPALFVVVTVSCTMAFLLGGDLLVGLGMQVVGAATFSFNWLAVAGGSDYFASGTPELLRNLWSLAVEEQFYVLWPLVFPLFLLLRRRWASVVAALGLAAASAGWAVFLTVQGADASRVYYGTDTHAFGLLLGVALAFALYPVGDRKPSILGVRSVWELLSGIVALVALVVVAATDAGAQTWVLGAASLLTALLILVSVWPGSWLGRALDIPPLRWIGARSYGIYLWHWPLMVLLVDATVGGAADGAIPVWLGFVVLALTLVLSALSYRFIEQPVRRHGFRGSLRWLGDALRATPARRIRAIATLAAGVLVVGGTTAAVAAAPEITSSEAVVAAGQKALDEADTASAAGIDGPPIAPQPAPTPSGLACPTDELPLDPADGVHAQCPPGSDGRPLPPVPQPVAGERITAVGDSVMLASAPGLLAEFPGIQVDAAVSRSMYAGTGIISSLAANGQLREFVVVGLGTNGPVSEDALQSILDTVGPKRHLILVNAYAPRDWIPGVNAELSAFAAAHPGVSVADWSSAIGAHTDFLAGDHIHPGAAGGRVFADTVAAVAEDVDNRRAQLTYQVELLQWQSARAFGRPTSVGG